MSLLKVLKNQSAIVDTLNSYPDQGWEISGGVATHSSCNAGYIERSDLDIQVGTSYEVGFTILKQTSGSVRAYLGDTAGPSVSDIGRYTHIIECTGAPTLKFFSNGNLSIAGNVSVKEVTITPGSTIAFNERTKLWASRYSFTPELMFKFIDKFIAFEGGAPWLQNSNPTRNNFFGVQYPSRISFYVNSEPTKTKLFHSLKVQSNKVWYSPNNTDIEILPYQGKSLGMNSRLKKKKFVPLYGDWFADFLRNVLDPRFNTELEALMYGEELRGEVMKITIENNDNTEVVLFEVDVKYSPQNYTI